MKALLLLITLVLSYQYVTPASQDLIEAAFDGDLSEVKRLTDSEEGRRRINSERDEVRGGGGDTQSSRRCKVTQ
jgi:hypothetical protein